MQRSESLDQLLPALLKVQAELKPAIKDKENPHFGSKYADLLGVVEASRPLLVANDLVVVQPPAVLSDGQLVIETFLFHSPSSQYIGSIYKLSPTKPGGQATGSEITYARRYSHASLVGVVTEDDDGNEAQPEEKKPEPAKRSRATKVETKDEVRNTAVVPNTVLIDGVEYATGGCTELQLKSLLALATFHGKKAVFDACQKLGVDKPTSCSEIEADKVIQSFAAPKE